MKDWWEEITALQLWREIPAFVGILSKERSFKKQPSLLPIF